MNGISLTDKLVNIIQDAFIYQVGPIGSIICDEQYEQWKIEHKTSHLELPMFITALINELPDEKSRKGFVITLKESRELMLNKTIKDCIENFSN